MFLVLSCKPTVTDLILSLKDGPGWGKKVGVDVGQLSVYVVFELIVVVVFTYIYRHYLGEDEP